MEIDAVQHVIVMARGPAPNLASARARPGRKEQLALGVLVSACSDHSDCACGQVGDYGLILPLPRGRKRKAERSTQISFELFSSVGLRVSLPHRAPTCVRYPSLARLQEGSCFLGCPKHWLLPVYLCNIISPCHTKPYSLFFLRIWFQQQQLGRQPCYHSTVAKTKAIMHIVNLNHGLVGVFVKINACCLLYVSIAADC